MNGTPNESNELENKFDVIGMLFSVTCIVHCLALPLLSSLLPTFTMSLEEEWIHLLLLALLIPVALYSFITGKRNHHRNAPLILGVMGIIILLLAIFTEDLGTRELESVLTLVGSLILILSHILNIKFKAACS